MKGNSIIVALLLLVSAGVSFGVAKLALPTQPDVQVGAVGGPNNYLPYFAVNDVKHYYAERALTTATSTPCALQAPNATSTLIRTGLIIKSATSTQTLWDIAKATTAFATTTSLQGQITVSSGVQGAMFHQASSTISGVDSADVFSPNQWVVWGAEGFLPAGTTKLTGFCYAEFVGF